MGNVAEPGQHASGRLEERREAGGDGAELVEDHGGTAVLQRVKAPEALRRRVGQQLLCRGELAFFLQRGSSRWW